PRDQRWAMVCTTTDIFSIALTSPRNLVDIDDVAVRVVDGKNLITNGDFSEGMSRWFFTRDRDHLPWHTKNLALNVLSTKGSWDSRRRRPRAADHCRHAAAPASPGRFWLYC